MDKITRIEELSEKVINYNISTNDVVINPRKSYEVSMQIDLSNCKLEIDIDKPVLIDIVKLRRSRTSELPQFNEGDQFTFTLNIKLKEVRLENICFVGGNRINLYAINCKFKGKIEIPKSRENLVTIKDSTASSIKLDLRGTDEVKIDRVECSSFWLNIERNTDLPGREADKFAAKECYINSLEVTNEIDLNNTDLDQININFLHINKASSSSIYSIRRIKKYFDETGNKYDYLYAASCEQKLVLASLKKETKFREKFREKFLLQLNCCSNEFGINWFRASIFTLSFGFIGSLVIYYSLYEPPYVYNEISPKFLSILFGNFAPLYKINFLEEKQASLYVYLVHFVTKIFVFYGIYQTVQAFRKYR